MTLKYFSGRTWLSALLFTAVSLLSFCCWAFGSRVFPSELTLYAACAVVFLLFGGVALLPVTASQYRLRLLWIFPLGFVAYSLCWCLAWFALRNTAGEVLGSACGLFVLALLFRFGVGLSLPAFLAWTVLFTWYTIGYYAGDLAHSSLLGRGALAWNTGWEPGTVSTLSRLAWGACYGAGFGMGLAQITQTSRHT